MSKKALITGITGQDGSYLAEFLLGKGYEVHGVIRRSSTLTTERIDHLLFPDERIITHYGNLTEGIYTLIQKIQPDEIYNTAAMSVSKDCLCPIKTSQTITYRTLEYIFEKQLKKNKKVSTKIIDGVEVEIIDMGENTQIMALSMINGMGTWMPIKQVIRHKYKGKMINLQQKWGSISVTPNHCIYDIHHNLCNPEDNPWLLSVRKINYVNRELDKIELKPYGVHKEEDGWFWLEEKGRVGKVFKNLQGETLSAFCRFMGAYISEGWLNYNKKTGAYTVNISNTNKKWLEELKSDVDLFFDGNHWFTNDKKSQKIEEYLDCWSLSLKSRTLFNIMKQMCGEKSSNKKLPNWFSDLNEYHMKETWKKLCEGGGSKTKRGSWRYSTISYKLACQLCLILTILKIDFTTYETEYENGRSKLYTISTCKVYQPNQGIKKINYIDYDDYVYDIEVGNTHKFAIGFGNVIVHNSHVRVSFDEPIYTFDINAAGVIRILEAIRYINPKIKFLQCSSSEMFGMTQPPQNETTPFHPCSPYGIAKLAAYWAVRTYRDGYGLFASNQINFNHESPRRGRTFVTKKIVDSAIRIKHETQKKLFLGNLDAKRDFGHAKDYVRAMWMVLQHNEPDDFVVASEDQVTIKEFMKKVFKKLNLNWQDYVEFDSRYLRPKEVPSLLGDASKIKKILNWQPKYNLDLLIDDMIEHAEEEFRNGYL